MLHVKKTPAQIERLLVEKGRALNALRAELTKLEGELAQATVAEDEVAAKRTHQRRDEVRTASRQLQDQIAILEGTKRQQAEQDEAKRYADRVAKTDAILEARVKLGAELDAWIAAGGELAKRLNAINGEAMQTMPRRLADIPHGFFFDSIQKVVGLKLYGATDGLLQPRHLGFENPHTARELPGLKVRLTEERARVLAQISTRSNSPVEAA